MVNSRKGEGHTALVTGGSTGIGVELAACFAAAGYNLILVARSEPSLRVAAERLEKDHHVKATPIVVDLGAQGAGRQLADDIAARGLAVDVLVNNAGYGRAGALSASDATEQLGMIDLNIRAVVELTQIYWPRFLTNRQGGVLNVASTAAFQPGPLMAVYYASKAFVLSFSEALWEEARGTGVNVSCLCPGPTISQFRDRAGTGSTRLSRMGAPMSSAIVARMGYEAWQNNQRVKITGVRNWVTAELVPFIPRARLLTVVRKIQSPL